MNNNKPHLVSVLLPESSLGAQNLTPAELKMVPTPEELGSEEAAQYIAELLSSLQDVAARANLEILSDLIYVAKEEATLCSTPARYAQSA